jgi:hypothetical protein
MHTSCALFINKPVIMKHLLKVITLIICSIFTASHAATYNNDYTGENAKSKRIEVYSLSQNYWDTRPGDTLSTIVMHLLPNNPSKHAALQQEILQLNPGAFINADPAKLLANKRLWLPGHMKQADSKANPETTVVERYSWGNIKRPR